MIPGGTAHPQVAAPPGYSGSPGSPVQSATDNELAALAYTAGWRGTDIPIAVAVAIAESSGKIDASNYNTNGTTDYGLWQINSSHFTEAGWDSHWTPPDLLIPEENAQAGYHVWKEQGWNAWSTFSSGAYLPYLARGRAAYAASGASGARGNVNIPTSFSILGINTPNWLGGFGNNSVLGVAGNAVQSISDFFKNFSILSLVKILGGGLILLIGIYALIKAG